MKIKKSEEKDVKEVQWVPEIYDESDSWKNRTRT